MKMSENKKQLFASVLLFVFSTALLPAQVLDFAFEKGKNQLDWYLNQAKNEIDEIRWNETARQGLEAALFAWEEEALRQSESALLEKEMVLKKYQTIFEDEKEKWLLQKESGKKIESFLNKLETELKGASFTDSSFKSEDWKNNARELLQKELSQFIEENQSAGNEQLLLLKNESENILKAEENHFLKSKIQESDYSELNSSAKTAAQIVKDISSTIQEDTRLALEKVTQKIQDGVDASSDEDITLTQKDWLSEFTQVLEAGLSKWEKAESDFIQNRIQWESLAENALDENIRQWNKAYSELEKRRNDWLSDTELKLNEMIEVLNERESQMKKDIASELSECRLQLESDYQSKIEAAKLYAENYSSYRNLMQTDLALICYNTERCKEELPSFTVKNYYLEKELEDILSDLDTTLQSEEDSESRKKIESLKESFLSLKNHMKEADSSLKALLAFSNSEQNTNIPYELEEEIKKAELEWNYYKKEKEIAKEILEEKYYSLEEVKNEWLSSKSAYEAAIEKLNANEKKSLSENLTDMESKKLALEKAREELALLQNQYQLLLESYGIEDSSSVKQSLDSLLEKGYGAFGESAIEEFFVKECAYYLKKEKEALENERKNLVAFLKAETSSGTGAVNPLKTFSELEEIINESPEEHETEYHELMLRKTALAFIEGDEIKEEMLPFVDEAVNSYGEFIPGVKESLMEVSFNAIKQILTDKELSQSERSANFEKLFAEDIILSEAAENALSLYLNAGDYKNIFESFFTDENFLSKMEEVDFSGTEKLVSTMELIKEEELSKKRWEEKVNELSLLLSNLQKSDGEKEKERLKAEEEIALKENALSLLEGETLLAVKNYETSVSLYSSVLASIKELYDTMEEKAQQLRVAEKIAFWKEADYLHGDLEKQQKFEKISALEKAAEEKYKNLLLEKEKLSLTDLSEEKEELLKKNSLLQEVIVFEFASDSLLAGQQNTVNEKEEKLLLTMQALLSQDMLLSQGENEMEREEILSLLTSLSSDTENFSSIISAFLYEKMLSDSSLNETAYAGNELNGIGDIAGFYHPRESYLGFRRNYLKAQYEKVNASTDLKTDYEKYKSYSNKLNSTYSNLLEDWAVKELTSVCLESLYSQMDNEIQVRKGVIAGLSVALVGNVALALINPFAISGVTSLTASIAVEEGVIKKIEDYKTQLSGFYSNRILRVEEAGEEKDQPLNQYLLALEELTEAEKELARLKGNSSSGNALTLADFTEGLKEKLYLTCFDEDSVSSVGNDFTYLTKKGKSFYSLSEALSSIKELRSQNLQLALNSIPSDADEIFVSLIEGQLDWKYANLSQPLTNVEQIVNLSLTPLWEKAQMVYSLREKELSLLLENFSNQKQELDSQFARMKEIAESEWQKGFDKFELEKNTWKTNFSRELLEKEAKWEDQYTAFLASKQEWLYRQYVYAENAASFGLMENSGLSVDEEIKKSLVQMESGLFADANIDAIRKNTEDFVSGLYNTSLLGKINAGLGLVSESALDLNFTVQNKNYYDGHSANALVLALEEQKDISEKMKTNAAHLASLQAEERIEKITAGLLERLEKENAAQEDYFLALFADSGYTLGDEMTRTITTDSSLLETKVDTQIVEKYKPFVAPTLPESGVRITSADNEKSLMAKTSLALENLSRWEKYVFGESVEDENGSLRAKYRTIARSVADAASSGNTSSYDESEIKVKESLERFNVLKEKLEQTTPDMDDFMATVAELQSLETDTVTVRDGAFGEYLGYSSRFKENPDVKKGMAANIEQKGRGEAGRLWDAYNWNEMVRLFGMGELNKSLYDKKLFISDGFFQAPTIRELTDLATNIASVATGGSLAPLIALADDAVFGLLDASLGYKDWGNAALDFTKAAVGTGISMGAGALSGVLGGVVDGLDSAAYSALDKLIFKTEIASGTALLSSGSNALLNGLQYDYENKSWTYDDALALSALSSPSVLAATLGAGVNVFVGGGLRENFTASQNKFLGGAASLAATSAKLAGEFAVHTAANGWDAEKAFESMGGLTFNLLDLGSALDLFASLDARTNSTGQAYYSKTFDRLKESGLFEVNVSSDGVSGKIGSGGVNIAAGLYDVAKRSIDAASLALYEHANGSELGKTAWNTYVHGDRTAENTASRIAAGTDVLSFTDEENYTGLTENNGNGRNISIKNTGNAKLNAVLLQHEAYRDGLTDLSSLQEEETVRAVRAHTEIALKMLKEHAEDFKIADILMANPDLFTDILAYNMGTDAFKTYANNKYESAEDFWRITWGGQLVSDGQGWLVDENGKYIDIYGNKSDVPIAGLTLGAGKIGDDGKAIPGSEGFIETGLLNIINKTSNQKYESFSDEQVLAVQALFKEAGIQVRKEGKTFRDISWENRKGKKINMTTFMQLAGSGVSDEIFKLYYNNKVDSFIAGLVGLDLGFKSDKTVPVNQYRNYAGLLKERFVNYYSTGDIKKALNDKYFQTFTNADGQTSKFYRIDENNPFIDKLLGQHDFEGVNESIDKWGCNFMSQLAVPQLLTGDLLSLEEIESIWKKAVKNPKIMEEDSYVANPERFADIYMDEMGLEYKVSLGRCKKWDSIDGQSVANRIRVPCSPYHFTLGDLKGNIIYNPGYKTSQDHTLVEVLFYGY